MLFDFARNDFGIYPTLVNKLFKRNILRGVLDDVDEKITYGEDSAIFYSYCMKIDTMYICHKAFYHYCIRKGSMCSDHDPEIILNTYRLYNVLLRAFQVDKNKDVLMRQLKRYVLEIEAHTMEMIYGINHGLLNKWVFKNSISSDNKVVIYGAGACGQAFFHYIRRQNMESNIVAWVDKDYKGLRYQCDYPIESVEDGLNKKHDIVIVAVKSESLSDAIKKDLIGLYGEREEAIVWCEPIEESFFSEVLY